MRSAYIELTTKKKKRFLSVRWRGIRVENTYSIIRLFSASSCLGLWLLSNRVVGVGNDLRCLLGAHLEQRDEQVSLTCFLRMIVC